MCDASLSRSLLFPGGVQVSASLLRVNAEWKKAKSHIKGNGGRTEGCYRSESWKQEEEVGWSLQSRRNDGQLARQEGFHKVRRLKGHLRTFAMWYVKYFSLAFSSMAVVKTYITLKDCEGRFFFFLHWTLAL